MQPPPTPWPQSIRAINDLPCAEKRAIYYTLLPGWVFPMFGISPEDYTVRSKEVIHLRCPQGSSAVELSVYHAPGSDEPALYLHMGDTFNSQLVVLLVIVSDPSSPRFNIDVDDKGRPTQLGTESRNILEEIRAFEAGLAPGQVRRGLRVFRTTIPTFEQFVTNMEHDLFLIEPLFYHNAVLFERYGFAYARGQRQMEAIDADFLPGGRLHNKLDNSAIFRQPGAWATISGRSWAIHDGVLGCPFSGVQMYKRVGVDAGIRTFSGTGW
jgi:hypothetical protein